MNDELGSGVRNIYKYNKIYSGADPDFIEGDVFKTIIPLTTQVNMQASMQATMQAELDDDDGIKELLEFCSTPRTRNEMQDFMQLKNREYFRKKMLNPLIKGNLLNLTMPDKPTSPNQKYYSNR